MLFGDQHLQDYRKGDRIEVSPAVTLPEISGTLGTVKRVGTRWLTVEMDKLPGRTKYVESRHARPHLEPVKPVAPLGEIKLPRKGTGWRTDVLDFETITGGADGPDGCFTITPARYAKLKVIVRTTGINGLKSRACRLAGAINRGKWTNRCKGYVMSPAQAEKFFRYYNSGWDASIFGQLQEPKQK